MSVEFSDRNMDNLINLFLQFNVFQNHTSSILECKNVSGLTCDIAFCLCCGTLVAERITESLSDSEWADRMTGTSSLMSLPIYLFPLWCFAGMFVADRIVGMPSFILPTSLALASARRMLLTSNNKSFLYWGCFIFIVVPWSFSIGNNSWDSVAIIGSMLIEDVAGESFQK